MIAFLRLVPLSIWLGIAAVASIGVLMVANEKAHDELELTRAELAKETSRAADLESSLNTQRELYAKAQAVNDEYDRKLNDQRLDNQKLSADLASGHRSVSISATCVPATRRDTKALSKPDDATPRLTDAAQRDYLTLRSGITQQASQIAGLQNYITKVCLKGQVQ